MKKHKYRTAALTALQRITSPSMALAIAIALGSAIADTRAANADNLPGMAAQPAEYFYTGKPYDADSGSYTFRYRNYDPELNRWTTADPSGFPDGANNHLYAPRPTSGYDPLGLYSEEDAVQDFYTVGIAIDMFAVAGYGMALRKANNALWFGANETAPSSDTNSMQSSSYFTSVFNRDYFSALVGSVGQSSPYSGNELVGYSGITDLHLAYGQVSFGFSGSFTWDSNDMWTTTATFSFSDIYDFDSHSPIEAIAAFARLQENNYAGTFSTNGEFTITYYE